LIWKALSERLAILLQSNPPQTAHTKLNKEVKEKLPKNANNGMVRKRTDTARKIYDIFSAIGEDKILRIKSFTAYSFLDLTKSSIAAFCYITMSIILPIICIFFHKSDVIVNNATKL